MSLVDDYKEFTVNVGAGYTLTLRAETGGSTDPQPGEYTVTDGGTFTAQAIPDSGYSFNEWTLNGDTYTQNPIDVVVTSDATLTAHFKEAEEKTLWDKIVGWWNQRTTVEKAFVVGAPSLLLALMIARPAPGRRAAPSPVVYPPYYPPGRGGE